MNLTDVLKSNPPNPEETGSEYFARIGKISGLSAPATKARIRRLLKSKGYPEGIDGLREFLKLSPNVINYDYVGLEKLTDEISVIDYFDIDTKNYSISRLDFIDRPDHYRVKVMLTKKNRFDIPYDLIEQKVSDQKIKVDATGVEQMWVVFGCVHRPFHNQELWASLMGFIKEHKSKITGFIINGDYLDLLSLSSHNKEDKLPDGIDLGSEYADGYKGLMEIKGALGNEFERVRKVYHFGNHEERYFRHIKKTLNTRYGNALESPVEALRLEEQGYEMVLDYNEGYTTLGNNLDVLHGHYFNKHSAAKHLEVFPDRGMIFNHTHRTQAYCNGKNISWNIGWMGDVNSRAHGYATRFQKEAWENGFAVAYIDQDGDHYINYVKASNNGFFFGGKRY